MGLDFGLLAPRPQQRIELVRAGSHTGFAEQGDPALDRVYGARSDLHLFG
jgi:hypothetical protein